MDRFIKMEIDVHLTPKFTLDEEDIKEALLLGLRAYWPAQIEKVEFIKAQWEIINS